MGRAVAKRERIPFQLKVTSRKAKTMQDTLNLRSATKVSKGINIILTAIFTIAIGNFASLAASDFIGTWNVKDTAGQPFEITLSGDATAKASLAEGMIGTWKQEGETAVITWNTGWTTKITREDDQLQENRVPQRSAPGRSAGQ
jgi:hypothetical protein